MKVAALVLSAMILCDKTNVVAGASFSKNEMY